MLFRSASSPAKSAGSQNEAAPPQPSDEVIRERKQKSSRDFVRKDLTESSSTTVKAPPRSILTPEQSGQLVAFAKDKKKRPVTPAMLTKALEASKEKRNRMPLQTKVLPNLLTPGGAELGDLARFVESWNSVDCPGSSSLSADLLKGVEDSVHALQDQLEVNLSLSHVYPTHHIPQSPRFGLSCLQSSE